MNRQTLSHVLQAHIPLDIDDEYVRVRCVACRCGHVSPDEARWAEHVTDAIYPRS